MRLDSLRKTFLKSWKIVLFLFLSWIVVVLAYQFEFFTLWQSKMYDRFFVRKTPPAEVIIVSIDDETISELKGWPIPRSAFAKVLDKLQSAKSIGFDVSFADPSGRGEADDWALAEALRKSKPEVFLALQFDDRGGKSILPIDRFLRYSKPAYVNVILHQDGVVRTLRPFVGDSDYFSLSLSLLGEKSGLPEIAPIDYYGPAKTFPYISFIDIYNGLIPEGIFKDKMVFIGATAPDLHDVLQTPFGVMPGVEIHANALATLQKGDFFKPISTLHLALLVLLFDILAIYIILRFRKVYSMVALLVVDFVLIQLLSIVAFKAYFLVPNLYISISFLLVSGFLTIYQYFSESKEKKMIRGMFQYYLMPEVIDELVANPDKLRLGGEKREMSILFSDIRDFTSISEKLSPEVLTAMLNEYLTQMTDAVMHERGFVDKYIGDAVMAFWGAPAENPLHAKDACLSALKMSEKLRELNVSWKERGLPAIAIGVGINTGDMVVGNIGSNTRFNYTVIGDEVNFGSRLEGLNKIYGTECIISEVTQKELAGDTRFILRELDLVTVKGKSEPKLIFELLTGPVDEKFAKTLKAFARGREFYTKGDFKGAVLHFKEALSFGADKPSSVFLERCLNLEQNPPSSWNGVYEFKTK